LINTTAREEHALWLSKGTIDHCGRGARAKKVHPLYIHSWLSKNMIQRKIFGIKKEDVSTTGGRREFQH
jgi:hypothetical protein